MYLANTMNGHSYQESLDMAWGLYARKKLADKGFNRDWERVYIELDEFEGFLGSMSVFHFGARYPCFSQKKPIPSDWWHLRLHLYIGNQQVRPQEVVDEGKATQKAAKSLHVVVEPVAENTIDLAHPPPFWRGLLAVLCRYVSRVVI